MSNSPEKARYELLLTTVSITTDGLGSSRVSRKLDLTVDGLTRTCISQASMMSWEVQWKVHPSVSINSASSVTVQPYQSRMIFPVARRRKKLQSVIVLGDTISRACALEPGDTHKYHEQGSRYRVKLGLTSKRVLKTEEQAQSGASDDLLSDAATDGALHRFPEPLSSSSYFKRSSQILLEELIPAVGKESWVFQDVDTTTTALNSAYEALSKAKNADEDVQALGELVCDLLSYIANPKFYSVLQPEYETIDKIIRIITSAAIFAEDVAKDNERAIESRQDLFKDFKRLLRKLKRNFTERKGTSYFDEPYRRAQYEINDDVPAMSLTIDEDDRLSSALYPHDARAEFAKVFFLEGTRTGILEDVSEWLNDTEAPNVLWLTGGPGSGKTAIAGNIITELDQQQRCGGSFIVNSANGFPHYIWRSIAFDLVSFNPVLKTAIHFNLVDETGPKVDTSEVLPSFDGLIVDPLTKSIDQLTKHPVILLDGIDHCDRRTYPDDWTAFLDTIGRWSELTPKVKLIVTSRGDEEVARAFKDQSIKRLELPTGVNVDDATNSDVRRYLEHRFREIRRVNQLPSTWPRSDQIRKIEAHSAGLFTWAQAAMDSIQSNSDDYDKQLSSVVSAGLRHRYDSVDMLYQQVLSRSFPNSDQPTDGFHRTIGALALEKAPLTLENFQELFEDSLSSSAVFLKLSSVISIDEHKRISLRHHSFAEYLMDRKRCTKQHFFIDRIRANTNVTIACLKLMLHERNGLRFNICGLESSHLANKDVPNIEDLVSKHIPFSLSYACRYWADHLRDLHDMSERRDVELVNLLRIFLRTRFLFWLEVLSLVNAVESAARALLFTADWLETSDKELASFAKDGSRFVLISRDPIRESAPHIYLSALAFAPSDSRVSKQYRPQFQGLLDVKGRQSDHSPALRLAWWPHDQNAVLAVAISADSKRIYSGQADGSVRVWDSTTGDCIRTMGDDSDSIVSIDISSSGKRLVSGCRDGSVRVWEVDSGILLYGPMEEHTDALLSVAISSDGSRVAAGSTDSNVRLWTLEAAHTTYKILEGHTDYVRSVAFSPDGKKIATGSDDRSIRMWSTETGRIILEPFTGHTDYVRAVAWSPDGRLVASGSDDYSVRMWDPLTGNPVGQPMTAHTGYVVSVAFDSESNRILSGSMDCTIRLWDIETCQGACEPLLGHTGTVNCVAMSKTIAVSASDDTSIRMWNLDAPRRSVDIPGTFYSIQSLKDSGLIVGIDGDTIWTWQMDGETIFKMPLLKEEKRSVSTAVLSSDGTLAATGEADKLVRIWAVESGRCNWTLKGHTEEIHALTFSLDTSKLASGSEDQTIRIWDAYTGECLCGPLQGHTGPVRSLAFSPGGSRIVSGSDDRTVRLWDVKTGINIFEPLEKHHAIVRSVVFSSDGKYVATTAEDNSIIIWDVEDTPVLFRTKTLSTAWDLHGSAVAFSPDGKRLACGNTDKTIRVLDMDTSTFVCGPLKGHQGPITCVLFSTTNPSQVISGSDDGTLRVWDTALPSTQPKVSFKHDDWVRSVSLSFPDGKYIASAGDGNSIRIRDSVTELDLPSLHWSGGSDSVLSFAPFGERIATGSDDCAISMWNAHTGESMFDFPIQHEDHIRCIAFSSDGQYIVSGSDDETVRIWNTRSPPNESLCQTFQGHGGWVYSVTFSPDGEHIASGSADSKIRIWSVHNAHEQPRLLEGPEGPVHSVLFFPNGDGRRLVSGSHDMAIRIWDVEADEPISTLTGHRGPVLALAISVDGTKLFSGSQDASIRIWDLESGAPLSVPIRGHTDRVLSIALSHDGRRLASGSADNTAAIWSIDTHDQLSWSQSFTRHVRGMELCALDSEGFYTDDSVVENGWVQGSRSEMLFWVPATRRAGLWSPRTVGVLGAVETTIDFSRFVHGTAWEQCRVETPAISKQPIPSA